MSDTLKEAIRIETWDGLISDYSATDIDSNFGTTVENCDLTSVGKLKKSRGTKSFGLATAPSGLTIKAFHEFHITLPTAKDLTVIYGTTAANAQKFYVQPYWNDLTGAWVDDWLELTEGIVNTIATAASTTSYTLTAGTGVGATDDYHNKWFVYVFNSSDVFQGYDYVLDYTASTRTITTKYGVAGTVAGYKVVLMRFPVFQEFSTGVSPLPYPYFQIDSLPTFTQHGEHLYIYTGSSKGQTTGQDLWLGFIGTATARQGYFDDSDLDFRGLHFDLLHSFKPLKTSGDEWISSVTAGNETDDPLPYPTAATEFVVATALLYDGFQESNIFFDETTTFTHTVTLPDATSNVAVTWTARFDTGTRRTGEWEVFTQAGYFMSRRVKRFLLYGAQGKLTSVGNAKLQTPLFLLKDIDIDDSGWSGSANYTFSTTIKGVQWEQAQKLEMTVNKGHTIEKTGANAKQGLQTGGFYVTGPIYADQEYKDTFVIAPLSGTLVGKNTMPNVLPLSLWVRCREQGIYEIVTMAELNGRLLVFGSNTMAIVELVESTILTGRIVEQFQKRGIISDRGVQVIDGRAYYCGRESIYAFDGNQVTDIGDRIKSDWNNITLANRQACFTGFNRRLKQFFIKAGSTLFVYSTEQNNWKTETLDKTWTFFGIGVDGEFLGTDGTDIFQLDATGYTVSRALHWKSKHFNSARIKPRRFRASYKGSDLITARIYDEEKSSTVPIETILLLPTSIEQHVNVPISFESTRISIDLQSSSSTNDDTEIDYVSLAETAKTQR